MAPSSETSTSTGVPSGLRERAFWRRLTSTCVSLPASPSTGGSDSPEADPDAPARPGDPLLRDPRGGAHQMPQVAGAKPAGSAGWPRRRRSFMSVDKRWT